MKMNQSCRLAFLVLMMAVIVGCASPSIYTVNMSYDASNAAVPTYIKPDQKALQSIIAVAEFVDLRQVDDTLVIGRVIEKDGMKVQVFPKQTRPTQSVAEGIRRYLRKAGYNVTGVVDVWDLNESTIPKIQNSKILIGGAINDIEINCRKEYPTNSYTAKIKLTIYVADIAGRKILHKASVTATTPLEHVMFSEERMGEQASFTLGEAIERLFERHDVAQAIRQSMER